MPDRPALIAVMGPTASGKTPIAEWIASRLDAQLISADAFMVYRGLDIGTNKPEHPERYELIDVHDPREQFGLGEFLRRARTILNKLWAEQRSAVVVGGTGLYVRALFEEWSDTMPAPPEGLRAALQQTLRNSGLQALVEQLRALDPQTAARIDLQNPVRVTRALERAQSQPTPAAEPLPPFQKFKLLLMPPIEPHAEAMNGRTRDMLASGWVDEVRALLKNGVRETDPAMKAIGYGEIIRYLRGEITLEECEAQISLRTRQYAKRQRTWLRAEPQISAIQDQMFVLNPEFLWQTRISGLLTEAGLLF